MKARNSSSTIGVLGMTFRLGTYLSDTSSMKMDFPQHALWPNHSHSGRHIPWTQMETVSSFPERIITAPSICSRNEISSVRLGQRRAYPSVDPIAVVGPGRHARSSLIRGMAMWAVVLAGRLALE